MLMKEVPSLSRWWNVSEKKSYRTRDIDNRRFAFYECVRAYGPAYYRKTYDAMSSISLQLAYTHRKSSSAYEFKCFVTTVLLIRASSSLRCETNKFNAKEIKNHIKSVYWPFHTLCLPSCLVRLLWKFWNSKASISLNHAPTKSNHSTYANQRMDHLLNWFSLKFDADFDADFASCTHSLGFEFIDGFSFPIYLTNFHISFSSMNLVDFQWSKKTAKYC